jgi:hypothetical protein
MKNNLITTVCKYPVHKDFVGRPVSKAEGMYHETETDEYIQLYGFAVTLFKCHKGLPSMAGNGAPLSVHEISSQWHVLTWPFLAE